MTIVFMTLSGILQYDMIDYYLFVTYVICVRARNSKLCWEGYLYYVHILVSRIVLFIIGLLLIGLC